MDAAMRSKLLNDVLDANATYVEAARCLCEAAAAAFPVGTRVCVTLGRARVDGIVTGVNEMWWASPGEVYIQNRVTGKHRRFSPWDESVDLVVIDEPQAVAAVVTPVPLTTTV